MQPHWAEWSTWAVEDRFPGRVLYRLRETGRIDDFPEIAALIGVPQNPEYHPEGDAFVHTALVCDAAVGVADRLGFDEADRLILMFAALCHDFGKPATTILNPKGRWTAPRHAMEGVLPATAFLQRMRAPDGVIDQVRPLVREHLAHQIAPDVGEPPDPLLRLLAVRLVPSTFRVWSALGEADALGCGNRDPRHRLDTWDKIVAKLEARRKKEVIASNLVES